MSENKNKLVNVGVDLSNVYYQPYVDVNEFDYVHTSIESNNDIELSIELSESTKLITTVNFLDNIESVINDHLYNFKKDKIELLLINSNCDFNKYADNINSLLESGKVVQIGISNPSSVEQLNKLKDTIVGLNTISLNICPLSFNYDIIKWCDEENINIFGFNPFGGSLTAPQAIDSFTIPYLLGFAATYSSVVFLSGKDQINLHDNKNYLFELLDKEIQPKYILKKSVNKLVKPLKKTIHTALTIGEDILPYNYPTAMYNPSELSLSLIKQDVKLAEVSEEGASTSFEDSVRELLKSTEVPEDGDIQAYIALTKTKIMQLVEEYYPSNDNCYYSLNRGADNIFVLIISKDLFKKVGWFKKEVNTETKNFLLYYSPEKTIFKEIIENGSEEA